MTGALTAAPLAVREARQAVGVPVLTLADLSDPEITARLATLLRQGGLGVASA